MCIKVNSLEHIRSKVNLWQSRRPELVAPFDGLLKLEKRIWNSFVGMMISGSGGAAVRINSPNCVHTLLSGCQFVDNEAGLSEAKPGLATLNDTDAASDKAEKRAPKQEASTGS